VTASYPTIQKAINAANPGDILMVPAGTYHERIVINKSITLKGAGMHLSVVDGEALGTVVSIKAHNVVIEGLTIRNAGKINGASGVHVRSVNNCIIASVFFEECDIAIKIDGSFDCKVYDCLIKNCGIGIRLWYISGNNAFFGNKIVDNNVGIDLRAYSYNSTALNNVIANNSVGIYVSHSYNNNIRRNTISKSGFYGIYLYGTLSQNNIITLNNVTQNYYGIYLWMAENNLFYKNNFINNTVHAYVVADSHPPLNKWNTTYPEGGNFWSGYVGEDKFYGSFQNIPGSDNIIDEPYVINEKNIDYYPLIYPVEDTVDHEPEFNPDLIILLMFSFLIFFALVIILKIKIRQSSPASFNKNSNKNEGNYNTYNNNYS